MNPYASSFFPSTAPVAQPENNYMQSALDPCVPEYTPNSVARTEHPFQENINDYEHMSGPRSLPERQWSYIHESVDNRHEWSETFQSNPVAFPSELLSGLSMKPSNAFERRKVSSLTNEEARESLEKAWAMLDLHVDGAKRMQERILFLAELVKSLRDDLSQEKKAHAQMDLEKMQIASERELYRKEKLKNKLLEERFSRLEIQLASERGANRREHVKNSQLRELYEDATEKLKALSDSRTAAVEK